MSLPQAFLDELRARVPLNGVVARRVKLTRAGREWKGCCPFHNEKTPSFYVNDDKGFYHCFGCGVHGDAIRFLTEIDGLPFLDAVAQLAGEAGLPLPERAPAETRRESERAGLHEVCADAAGWFTAQLDGAGGADARSYLARRGVTADIARAFGLGFAPDGRGKLRAALARHGEAALAAAGLTGMPEDGGAAYDRFRGRVMFPIHDARGRVVGFGGRALGDASPKYLNSPEGPLFDKGRLLYNLHRAAPAARKAGRLFVVEGYMDVIGLAGAGVADAVAPNGTALTEAQLALLWRVVPEPVLCFDGDAAGQRAAVRAAHRALPLVEAGRTLRFMTLPPGQDPDDLVRGGGAAAWEALAAGTKPLVDVLWEAEHAQAPLDTPERRAGLRARLRDLARTVADAECRRAYEEYFRERLDALFAPSPRAAWVANGKWQRPPPPRRVAAQAPTPEAALVFAELLHAPALIDGCAETLAELPLPAGALSRLRDVLLGLADLSPPALAAALGAAGLDADAARLRRQRSALFTTLDSPALTTQHLNRALASLAALHHIDINLQQLRTRYDEPDTSVLAEQRRLVDERDIIRRTLLAIAHPDGPAAG